MAYTEEELEGLTDEERAALLEDDGQDDGEQDNDSGEGDGAGDGEGGDDGQEGDGEGDDGADGQGDGQDGEGDDGQGDEGGADKPADQGAAPILVAEAPEKAQERLQEIADEKKSLRKQYDDGELTFEDYESKVEALDDERLELKLALNTAETAARIAEQQAINAREAEINSFLSEVGIPRDPKNLRFATLDVAVRIVATDEANYDLGPREILAKAYDLCVEQGTLQPRGTKQTKPAAEEQGKDTKPAAKPAAPRKPAPPTLAKVPAAAATGAEDGSRFAYLDRLDPVQREAAFAKLSTADQEAYLQQA